MPSDRRSASSSYLERRWRIPPLPTHLSGAFAGMAVLEEVAGGMGLALWQSLRDVMLWASAPSAARARLFAPGAARARAVPDAEAREADLREPLDVLLAMVEDGSAATAEGVALACMRISQWAEERGASATALAFAEAAASAAPGYAAMAVAAGRLSRQKAEFARAESWYLRAMRLGRQSGDWDSYASALNGLARIQLQRGALPRGRKYLRRVLRTARRFGLRKPESDALHELFIAAAEGGNVAEAEGWARQSFEVQGPGHPELPRLAHDLAHFWVTQGYFARALVVMRALLPYWEKNTRERLYIMADVCRAAGGTGERPLFEEAWSAVWDRIETLSGQDAAAQSLLDIAHGAASLGEHARAEAAARRALELATARREGGVCLEAEALLESLRAPAPRHAEPETVEEAGPVEGDFLAAEIAEGLAAHAPG